MQKNGKKRVLFVTESLARGGMETVLVTISNALVIRGYDVTNLCYNPLDELRKDLNPAVRYIYKPRREFKVMNRIPHIRRYYNYRKAAWEHRVSPSTLYKYYVGNQKYDVEIGFYRGPSIKIISGSTNKESIKIAWVHTDFKLCDIRTVIGWFNNLDEAKTAYGKMDRIVCVSNQAKNSFSEVIGHKDKTTTVYNMISTSKIEKLKVEPCPLIKRRFTFVTVGRLIPDKRQDRILTAAKKLRDEGYKFDVWIVGGGRAEDELKGYCTANHLDNVVFTGMQDNPYKYLSQADVFVLSSNREGFAIVIPEAMACGLPVLSTRCTGPIEILNDGEFGLLVNNDDESIYNGMKSVLENKDNLLYYKSQSMKRFHSYENDLVINDLINLFNNEKK